MTRYRSGSLFYIILELSKVRITVAVAFTTITGYILALRGYNLGFILPTLGIFFLACGSSVINHLQERHTDAMMSRTRQRPLPAHKISLAVASWIALVETFTGSLILYFSAGILALLLGLIAMVWYNGVYTYLKRITPNAVIPGSVIGSIPPLVGWVSAGGNLFGFQAGILALFFFIWQVPHFYLLALQFGHEYEEAGLPSIVSQWSSGRTRSHIFAWIILTAIAAVVIAFTQLPSSVISSLLIVGCSFVLVISFRNIRGNRDEKFNAFSYFMKINYFVLAVTLILIAGPLLYRTFNI
jgi:protoheme IX farnesyltransferase